MQSKVHIILDYVDGSNAGYLKRNYKKSKDLSFKVFLETTWSHVT